MMTDHGKTLEDLVEISNKPKVITHLPFGKHKGVAIKDVPKAYIQWMLNTVQNLDPELRKALEAA